MLACQPREIKKKGENEREREAQHFTPNSKKFKKNLFLIDEDIPHAHACNKDLCDVILKNRHVCITQS